MSTRFKSYKTQVLDKIKKNELATLEALGIAVSNDVADNVTALHLIKTGALHGSFFHQVNQKEKSVRVGTDKHYGIYLEKGTSRGIKAYRFFQGAVEKNTARYKEIAEEYMNE